MLVGVVFPVGTTVFKNGIPARIQTHAQMAFFVTAFQIILAKVYIPSTKSRWCLRSVHKSVVPSTLHLLRHEQVVDMSDAFSVI